MKILGFAEAALFWRAPRVHKLRFESALALGPAVPNVKTSGLRNRLR
jgi:hypothetical protein